MLTLARRKTKHVYWSRWVGVGVVLFPLSVHQVDFRSTFSRGLSISTSKSSPAYAAFEDLREEYKDDSFQFPEKSTRLASGTKFDFAAASRALQTQRIVAIRQVSLKGLTLRAPAPPVENPVDHRALEVASQVTRRPVPQMLPALHIPGNLTPKQKLAMELEREDWSIPTPGSAAKELVQRELQTRQKPMGSGTLLAQNGSNAVIRRSDPSPSGPPGQEVASVETTPENGLLNFANVLSMRNPDPANLRPLWLAGQVEMTEGLAFVGPETQMSVKRVFNGYTYDTGRIWVSEGRFEIRVKEPVGYLVAELSTRDGRILGRGEINLLDLRRLPQQEDKVANLHIALHPTSDGVSLHAISGYSHGQQKMAVSDARVEIQAYSEPQKVNSEGVANEPGLSRDSSFVARAQAKGHWPSLVIGQANQPQDVRLYANSLVQALINLSLDGSNKSDRRQAAEESVIWGRLVQDGQTATGAQVEMAGDYHPIYFNEMYLPDPKLTATTANGLFAFVKVHYGVQALRVKIGGRTYPAQIFPTENKHVSYVELDIRAKVVSQFRVFDAFDMHRPVSANIRLVGNDETLEIGKDDFVEYSVAANPFMVEADAGGEFETTRVTVTGSPHVVHVPLIERTWLYEIAQAKSIVGNNTRGTIVGLIDGASFEVELTGYAAGETMQIVYLDAHGKALDSRTGVPGGGFVIFNAPPGLQTLYVHGGHETFSQVVVAEPQFVSVITH